MRRCTRLLRLPSETRTGAGEQAPSLLPVTTVRRYDASIIHHGFEVNQKVEWDGNRAREGAAASERASTARVLQARQQGQTYLWRPRVMADLQIHAHMCLPPDVKSSPICCCTFDPVNQVNWYEAESLIDQTTTVNMVQIACASTHGVQVVPVRIISSIGLYTRRVVISGVK